MGIIINNVKDYIQNIIVNVHSYKTSWLKMIVVFLFVANTSSVNVGVMVVQVQWDDSSIGRMDFRVVGSSV